MTDLTQAHYKLAIRQAYMEPDVLVVRERTQAQYSEPHIDFPRWALTRQNDWRGDEVILDISPGSGSYFAVAQEFFPDGKYIATDLSAPMLRLARKHPRSEDIQLLVTQSEAFPFGDHTFDIVLANNVLYYAPDLAATLAEIHRILKPTGLLVATTSSQYTMAEFDTLTRRALTLLGHPPRESTSYYGRFIENFSLETGTIRLARHFRAVARHELPSTLIFKDARPVIDYLNSSRAIREASLPSEVSWDDFLVVMADQIRRLINHFGELAVNCLSGVLLATDGGGFSRAYFAVLDR